MRKNSYIQPETKFVRIGSQALMVDFDDDLTPTSGSGESLANQQVDFEDVSEEETSFSGNIWDED